MHRVINHVEQCSSLKIQLECKLYAIYLVFRESLVRQGYICNLLSLRIEYSLSSGNEDFCIKLANSLCQFIPCLAF